jgi:cation diffusion facilitator family transporter
MNLFKEEKIKYQLMILLVGLVLMTGKFIAWVITNSNAIFTDAIESIINVVAGAFGLYSLILSAKPSDEDHPYGHGKIEFISASIEGVLIAIAGIVIIIKSVYNLIYPQELSELNTGIIITAAAGFINFFTGVIALKKGSENDSLVLTASGRHLKSDALSTFAIIVGLILVLITGYIWLDSLVAIVFGVIICITAYRILTQSIAGIMDQSDFVLIARIIDVLDKNRSKNWMDAHNLRVIKYGSVFHIDCHLTVPYYFNVNEAHAETDKLDTLISAIFKNKVELFIHTDACVPPSQCGVCIKDDCPVRQQSLKKRLTWNLENVMQNQRHNLNETPDG